MGRARFRLADAAKVVAHRKRVHATKTELWREAARIQGASHGNGREGWSVAIYAVKNGIIRATLSVGSAPIEGLDFHRRPSDDHAGGRIGAGYHWDVFYPQPRKHELVPQPVGRDEALAALIERWHIELLPETQGTLTP